MGDVRTLWNNRVASVASRDVCTQRPWYGPAIQLLQASNLEPGMKALDLGCGAGEFTQMLMGRGFITDACDGEARRDRSTLSCGVEVRILDLECVQLPFKDSSYDVVACLEVIEHIANAELLMHEIFRIMKVGAYLVISTPNCAWLPNRLSHLLGRPPVGEGVHLRFFTKRTFTYLLHTSGFRIVGWRSFTPTGIGKILRLLNARKSHYIRIPSSLESVLAWDFVWLAQKECEIL
jgi:2-polyprenyl-3-methyl-5-hydroxy-6-metoxy-1,4-benzoquinol methylase